MESDFIYFISILLFSCFFFGSYSIYRICYQENNIHYEYENNMEYGSNTENNHNSYLKNIYFNKYDYNNIANDETLDI